MGLSNWIDRLTERVKERNRKLEIKDKERAERIKRGEPSQSLNESAQRMIYEATQESTIFTCPQGVIIYRVNWEPSDYPPPSRQNLEKRLAEILSAHPTVDLSKIAPTLGIAIIDDQRTSKLTSAPDSSSHTQSNPTGSIRAGRKLY